MTDSYDNELIERMERILTATANALHGGYAPPDCLHSWHDLPELVEKLRKERDEARREVMLWMSERSSTSEMNAEYKKRGWEYLKEESHEP